LRNNALLYIADVVHGGDITPTEGDSVELPCSASPSGNMVIWLRVVDHRVEFIGSFVHGNVRKFPNALNIFTGTKMRSKNTMHLRSFQAARDVGVYSCAVLNSGVLEFGEATRLLVHGERVIISIIN